MFSTYKKQRILYYHLQGFKPPTIAKLLRQEDMRASRWRIHTFIQRYEETGTTSRRAGSGRPSKVTAEIRAIVEEQMRRDDETTTVQLHRLLNEKGYDLSRWTILRCRRSLGWTFRGSVRKTNRSAFSGLGSIRMMPSRTSYGRTNVACS